MPQNQKASVNNLVVVWQGQSWSVVAPDGKVLFRHWSRDTAMEWASQNFQYAPLTSKLRSLLEHIVGIALLVILIWIVAVIGFALLNQAGTSQSPESITPQEDVIDSQNDASNQVGIPESIANRLSQVNWFGLIVFGLFVLGLVALLKELADQGCESLLIGVLIIGVGLFICNACGLLNLFLDWVF